MNDSDVGDIAVCVNALLQDTNKKIVIHTKLEKMAQDLERRIDGKLLVIGDSDSPQKRNTTISSFQNDGDCRVLINGMSMGITLAAMDVPVVLLYASDGNRMQAEDRCHRITVAPLTNKEG